jgi:hypothetical protein
MDEFDERVRQRAYRLWVEEGCPEGRSDVHWEKARELVAIEGNQKPTPRPAPRGEMTSGEPVEPIEAVENAGEFPTMTHQGEQAAPKRRRASPTRKPATGAPPQRKVSSAAKQPSDNGARRR